MTQATTFTARQLITLAAKKCGALGVGQTLSGQYFQDCFDLLNMMMAELAEQRLNVLHLLDVSWVSTGALSYTVGPGGDVNTIVPIRIDGAQFVQNAIVYPLTIVHAKEDFKRIPIPSLASFPEYIFLDTAYPLPSVYVWPVPNNTYTIRMQIMAELQTFANSTDVVNLRPVYQNMLVNNLAISIAPIFSIEAPPSVVRAATTSKRAMQKANTQIPLLQMPKSVLGSGHYNVYSDRNT